jgi:hypothetical protein
MALELYERFAGRSGNDLRQELVAVVDKFFSAGILSFYYDI